MIDDFSASKVNEGLSASEAVDPDDLDKIALNAKAHMTAFSVSGDVREACVDFAKAKKHGDHEQAALVSRLWDLEAAYRQLARSPAHASFTVIAVWDPKREAFAYFQQPVLAFGASASVFAFNWAAAALKAIFVAVFKIGATNFYDDFDVIETADLADSAKDVMDSMFDLLGWKVKALPGFDVESEPLGAVLDLADAKAGIAKIRNKKTRIDELVAAIEDAGKEGEIKGEVLPRLRGRLLFSRSLCYGRAGGNALRALSAACADGHRRVQVAGALARALYELHQSLLNARPREITVRTEMPVIVFTDGSFDYVKGKPQAGIGGVLLDPVDKVFMYYGTSVPSKILDELLADGAQTVIHELEILPVLVAKRIWGMRLRGRRALHFVDNTSSMAVLVAGYSANHAACSLAAACAALDLQNECTPWYERVPSPSNVADAPSRGSPPVSLDGWCSPVASEAAVVGAALQFQAGALRAEHDARWPSRTPVVKSYI